MKSLAMLVTVVVCLLAPSGLAQGAENKPAEPVKFAVAHARFEQNATDGDVEAVFEVSGRKEGVTKLKVVAPNGRTVIDFSAPVGPDASRKPGTVGIRQFTFESPEPTDIDGLKASYPAGEYTFTGATASGAPLQSKAKLDHTLPATTSFVFPKRGAHDVPTKNLQIKWAPVKGVAGYALELESDESTIEAKLPDTATSFVVPDGFLAPGAEYQLGIGAISTVGNVSYVEMDFTTADK